MYDDVALDKDLAVLESQGAKVFTIGYTVLGRPIKCVVKGNLSGPCPGLHIFLAQSAI